MRATPKGEETDFLSVPMLEWSWVTAWESVLEWGKAAEWEATSAEESVAVLVSKSEAAVKLMDRPLIRVRI